MVPATAALMIVGVLKASTKGGRRWPARFRMTVTEVVRQVLREEHGDVIRESVRAVARELMNLEVSELIGAELGERTEDRATHRNGYRPRRWDTRAGEIGCSPEDPPGQLLPEFSGAAEALRAGARERGAAGVCVRRLDQAG